MAGVNNFLRTATSTRRLLLTGRPGVGKTTVVCRLAELLGDWRLAGFYTLELRHHGGRQGFRAVTFDHREWVIAHVDLSGTPRVGKYGVDVAAIDELADLTLTAGPEIDLFIVDEIGKMECLSAVFVARIRRLLDSEEPLVATVAERGSGLVPEVKKRTDCVLGEVNLNNRNELPEKVAVWLRSDRRWQ
jgi:nucleoside-triphosphatase